MVCADESRAGRFWLKLEYTANYGIKVTPEIMAQSARAEGCTRLTSLALRPVAESADLIGGSVNVVQLADGDRKVGWASLRYYILYMSDPRVRKPREGGCSR